MILIKKWIFEVCDRKELICLSEEIKYWFCGLSLENLVVVLNMINKNICMY